MSKKLTTEIFIERSKELNKNNGSNISYEKTVYINSNTKLCMTCHIIDSITGLEHGDFWITPHNFLHHSCPACGRNNTTIKNTSNKDEFITKSVTVHTDDGSNNNYSKFIYINNHTNGCITCENTYDDGTIHGDYWQTPNAHLIGQSCPICDNIMKTLTPFKQLEFFIITSNNIHNNFYDYSKFIYVNTRTKGCIICPIHGEFWQTPNAHHHSGCPYCTNNRLRSLEQFIIDAKNTHKDDGSNYTYEKFIYINNHTKGIITCHKKYKNGKEHGDFLQAPDKHINKKHGCSKCNSYRGELSVEQFLKENNIIYENQKRYTDCRDILPLPFDFYLPDLNILIEYDGNQHRDTWMRRTGEKYIKALQTTQKHDKIKNEYCKTKGIKLIRIPDTKINYINDILSKELLTK